MATEELRRSLTLLLLANLLAAQTLTSHVHRQYDGVQWKGAKPVRAQLTIKIL